MKRYNQLFEMAKEEAYWISPRGQILPMSKKDKHIAEIIKNPKAFGYTREELQDIYDKYGEKFGNEGKAREEIILSLIRKGWTRIRKYIRPDRWTVNVVKLTSKVKDILQFWADKMLSIGYSKYDDVYIDLPKGKQHFIMQDLANDILYAENAIPEQRFKVELIESVFEFTNK